jgi:glycosyltransferase involved in cell wall biosynthesis
MGTFFEEQARALIKLGHKVGILFPEFSSLRELFDEKEVSNDFYMDDGLPTFTINVQSKIPRLRQLSYYNFSRAVNKIFEDYVSKFGKPDVIHGHSLFFGGIAAYYIARKHRIPIVVTEHLTAFIMGTISNREDRILSCEIFSNVDAALIVSNNFKSDLQKELSLPKDTFKVVHNMVADLFFDRVHAKPYLPGDEFIFFTNSFLLPRKNHKLIFDALKILVDKKYKVKLRVGGDGPLMNELKNYARESDLEKNIEFIGGIIRLQVKQVLDDCHTFLLASFYETFGVVLIESLACGRPVISTDSGGPRDIINDSNGILVNEFSAHKFASAMEKMINNFSNYDQLAISKSCFDCYNELHIAKEIVKVYDEVVENRKVRSVAR